MSSFLSDSDCQVSNPLRVEGDAGRRRVRAVQRLFLLHYGWRGTGGQSSAVYGPSSFLIHYGWRGTSVFSM